MRRVFTALWCAQAWLTFHTFDLLRATEHPSLVFRIWAVAQACLSIFLLYTMLKHVAPKPAPAPKLRSRAYLVLHIDIEQSPPVATFACIYSASAQDLTRFGRETKADLYRVEANTFEEALHEMEQIAPLYFPWVVPLMTRKR